jgi:hypothetical protein
LKPGRFASPSCAGSRPRFALHLAADRRSTRPAVKEFSRFAILSLTTQQNGRILAKLIPDSQFVTIDDGHLFLLTSAKHSASIIAEFLT